MTTRSPRLRFAEIVPPLRDEDARRLHGLPASWESVVSESAIDALVERARAMATALAARGRKREAADLARAVAVLERAAELHDHAHRVETLAQLYRSLVTIFGDGDPSLDDATTWVQAGAVDDASGHGPAFRATAALRNRAYRRVEAAVAAVRRSLG